MLWRSLRQGRRHRERQGSLLGGVVSDSGLSPGLSRLFHLADAYHWGKLMVVKRTAFSFGRCCPGLECAYLSISTQPAQAPPHPHGTPSLWWVSWNSHKVGLPYLASHVDYQLLRGKNHLHTVYSKYMLMNQLIDKPKEGCSLKYSPRCHSAHWRDSQIS